MTTHPKKRVRCVIYTRVSTEYGLEQDFNSLDAQRDAAEAYIRSQAHDGWTLVRTRYDDGGFSGGSTDRPALQQLLADISDGKVDVIVVYKVDRLTRSLADFAKLVELFERRRARAMHARHIACAAHIYAPRMQSRQAAISAAAAGGRRWDSVAVRVGPHTAVDVVTRFFPARGGRRSHRSRCHRRRPAPRCRSPGSRACGPCAAPGPGAAAPSIPGSWCSPRSPRCPGGRRRRGRPCRNRPAPSPPAKGAM